MKEILKHIFMLILGLSILAISWYWYGWRLALIIFVLQWYINIDRRINP